MKTIIFDGQKFAAEKEEILKMRVLGPKTRGVYPKLASIIIGGNPASELYVGFKKKAAARVGAEVDIYKFPEKVKPEEILFLIKVLNEDTSFQGIMVQMPLPNGEILNSKSEILNTIDPEKDVDGLKESSQFLHPTAKAVIQIIDEAKKDLHLKTRSLTVAVVGAKGMVGRPLVKELGDEGHKVIECDINTNNLKESTSQADVVVSATGKMNLITADMVKEGSIVIDVGSPFGDVDFAEVSQKAAFITPVPGGVGPVTITCLLENLISAC